jgi:hypothetical protein
MCIQYKQMNSERSQQKYKINMVIDQSILQGDCFE